ncbi:MAG: hypothetical protein Q9211_006155 [Gyalolechia sp. 1 TL-2023]
MDSGDASVVVPSGILSTCYGQNRRSYDPRARPLTSHGGRRVVSMITATPEHPSQQDQAPAIPLTPPSETIVTSDEQEESGPVPPIISDSERPQPAAIDFAQFVAKEGAETDREKQNITLVPPPVLPEATIEDRDTTNRSSAIFKRLSYVARSVVGNRFDRQSVIGDGRANRYSVFFRRPSYDSHYVKEEDDASKKNRRQSKAIPKSWKFLGIDGPGVEDALSNVKSKLRKSNFSDMYEKAKVKQDRIRRSEPAQLIFRYTFYLLLVATVYLLLVGLPLWRGLVWYLYILFKKHLVLKAGMAITFGIGFLYAFCPLLVNFEPTAPLPPEADESGRPAYVSDTALVIPCYKSANIIGVTLEAALKIFPKQNIFLSGVARISELTRTQVIANGNSPEPLDNTAEVCKQYDVSHTWSPLGSKIIAQFVGCYVARKFPYVLLIDDDCALPPNLPIVSDRLRGNIKCIGYIMKSVGEKRSKGTICQQAQDLEYKLSGLAKAFAGKVGSVTFPHGCIVLWDRELLVQTFQEHPGFSVSEDWFFGHAARQLGCRITMCTSTFVETETPSNVFFSSGGARGGFGEMTIWSQRFYRWNYFFVTGMYYDLAYILFDWKLGWWEIGAKIFVFQEIYETLLYLLAPFVIPISFATRPIFALEIYIATIVMYVVNATIFNWFHLRSRQESVSFKAFLYYNGFKWVLGFVNIASCYYAIWTYATYFAKRHPKVIEDDKAIEIVLGLEKEEAFVSQKGEIDDLNELMYKIAKPVGGGGNRRSVMMATTKPGIEASW